MSAFIGENPRLEYLAEGDGPAAVITHPHPLMGGDMHNNVVATAARAAVASGFSSWRFNFRGVGRSQGTFDEGNGETADLAAIIDYSRARILIGYSFGAWIVSRYLHSGADLPAILIAPPTAMFDHPDLRQKDIHVISGANDQFCRIDCLDSIFPADAIEIINGCDHFWCSHETSLYQYLETLLRQKVDQ